MQSTDLAYVYDGGDGYHRSIVNAIADLAPPQLEFRAAAGMRSVGELAWHIGDGRVVWFRRIDAPGRVELQAEVEARESATLLASDVVQWLDRTWEKVSATLAQWSVSDLEASFQHPYEGKVYEVSRQWVIWRIMGHDIHDGELSEMLALQGVEPVELTLLGGHLTEPPVVS